MSSDQANNVGVSCLQHLAQLMCGRLLAGVDLAVVCWQGAAVCVGLIPAGQMSRRQLAGVIGHSCAEERQCWVQWHQQTAQVHGSLAPAPVMQCNIPAEWASQLHSESTDSGPCRTGQGCLRSQGPWGRSAQPAACQIMKDMAMTKTLAGLLAPSNHGSELVHQLQAPGKSARPARAGCASVQESQ